ncbi:hypothetical protein TKK_0002472 [Trichogramma kaykai]|uniref:PX domain-containing protein n=1 Tax=Trichogramma kaykai TaxID=54128 RepID=A0ABD2VXM2_9HYME
MMTPIDPDLADDQVNGQQSIEAEVHSPMLTPPSQAKSSASDDGLSINNSTSVEGSVVASPSIESFSTFPEQEEEIFDAIADHRDLQVKVDCPQKHVETLETFITFRITTKSTRSDLKDGEYVVRRRYNDFAWIRQKLVETYPAHIIPPMPGKHTLLAQLDRYSKEFILARMRLLHIFLNRIASHPILSCDKDVCAFLTAQPTEFMVYKKSHTNTNKGMDPRSLTAATMKNPIAEFEHFKDYCIGLSDKLSAVDKISRRINKERHECLAELNQLHPIFTMWASSEPELSKTLEAIAKALHSNANAHKILIDSVSNEEKEYVTYVEAVKDALNRRDAMQIEYELSSEELNKRTVEKQEVEDPRNSNNRWDGSFWKSESSGEKLSRLSLAIPRILKVVEVLHDRIECANENLRCDIQRWNAEKQADLKNMLIAMADKQIEHYEQTMQSWEEALATIKETSNESDTAVNSPRVTA